MARFLYFLLVVYLARLAWSLAAQWLSEQTRKQMGGSSGSASPHIVDRGHMVRDPVCGLHLPQSRALEERRSGQVFHFCSEGCRQEFIRAR